MTDFFSPDPLPPGTRVACRLEYDGSRYHGWQIQHHLDVPTVQQTLEAALSQVAGADVRVHSAGRTDTGVHACAQVVHFDAPVSRSPKAWVLGGNASLPFDVRLHWALPVPEDFHARFSAIWRRYRYIIANTGVRPAHLNAQVTWYRQPLDAGRMQRAAQCLLGEQDFSAFRAAACQSASPHRNVQAVSVRRCGPLVVIDIRANAFLHHMVRNIAGSLLAVGSGRRHDGWLAELLAGRDRNRAADTAPPDGLYLVDVGYPGRFALQPTPEGPLVLAAVSAAAAP
ncbi:MAG: tRNA pseudouridine(38-40) synthase TruA [Parahaliea sp.]